MIIQLQFSEIMGCANLFQRCLTLAVYCVSSILLTCVHLITRLTPGVLLPPDHRHEFKILIPITLLEPQWLTCLENTMLSPH
jgi:hypothetical protein